MANEVRVTNQKDVVEKRDIQYPISLLSQIHYSVGLIIILLFVQVILTALGLFHFW